MSEISYYRGDTEPIVFTFKDSDGSPIDVTGWQAVLTVNTTKYPVDASDQVFQLVGVLADDPATGVVIFFPEVEDTDRIGTYFYDIQRTDASDKIKTLISGYKFRFLQDITKI